MRYHRLEALRGFAALYVVLHHTIPHSIQFAGINFGLFLRFGQEAVIIFFLLSGFVISISHSRSTDKTFRTYFLKRFIRIYVPLLIVLLLGYGIISAQHGYFVDPELRTFALNIAMVQDIAALKPNVIASPYLNNSPLWSLSYEWWFYMLFFPIQRLGASRITQAKIAFSASVIASIIYVIDPTFVPRVIMYLSIWWAGVYAGQLIIEGQRLSLKNLAPPLPRHVRLVVASSES